MIKEINLFKGLVTHNHILKIYRIIQYSGNIIKCNMVKNIFEICIKITFLLTIKPHNEASLAQDMLLCFVNSMS